MKDTKFLITLNPISEGIHYIFTIVLSGKENLSLLGRLYKSYEQILQNISFSSQSIKLNTKQKDIKYEVIIERKEVKFENKLEGLLM